MKRIFEQTGRERFEANARVLEGRFGGGWWDRLEGLEIDDGWKLFESRSGGPTLARDMPGGRRVTVHSRFDPAAEAERFVAEQLKSGVGNVLAYGFGLGYHLEAARAALGDRGRLIVVDVAPEPFALALAARDLVSLLEWKGLRLVIAGLAAGQVGREFDAFLAMDADDRALLIHAPSIELLPPQAQGIRADLDQFRITAASTRRLGRAFRENEILNMGVGPDADAAGLFGTRPGAKIIVAGAGPSLDLNAGLLAQAPGLGVCVAASDRALNALLQVGRVPEYVVSIDPQTHVIEHFKKHGPVDSELVYSVRSNPRIKEFFKSGRWLFFPESCERAMPSGFDGWGELATGGSVALAAMDLAVKMGAGCVVFVGMDLAFTGGAEASAASGYRQPGFEPQSPVTVESADGELLPTTPVFLSFKRTIERYITEHPEVRFIDATEGGARINGAETMPLARVLEF